MVTSAGRAQLITAERIWHNGQAHADWGIAIDAQGRIEAIGPFALRSRSTLHFANKVLLPSLLDAFAPGCLSGRDDTHDLAPHPAEPPEQAITLGYPRISASANALYARLRAAMLSRLRLGVTCIGVPHVLASRTRTLAGKSPHPLADLMVAAAQDVGMRIAICAGPPADCGVTAGIEALHDDFRGLVGHIVSYADARLSWAQLVFEAAHLPLDALVSLKLRMAHLPLLLAAEPLTNDVYRDQAAQEALRNRLVAWRESGLLDATTTVLVAGELPAALAHLLASCGCSCVAVWGQPSPLLWDGYARGEGALGFGAQPAPQKPRGTSLCELSAWQRPAGAALGLRTPGWNPGRWADLMTLPWPQEPASERVGAKGPRALDVLVAGQLVLRDGRHRFDDLA